MAVGCTLLSVVLLLAIPGRHRLEVGAHRLRVLRPSGFDVVPRERSVLFRDGPVLVELTDMGAPGGDPNWAPTLDDWVAWGLGWLDSSRQREVSHRSTRDLEGRECRVVETRDVLTHGSRRRFAFVLNEGGLLVMHTRGGDFEAATAALERILAELRFLDVR